MQDRSGTAHGHPLFITCHAPLFSEHISSSVFKCVNRFHPADFTSAQVAVTVQPSSFHATRVFLQLDMFLFKQETEWPNIDVSNRTIRQCVSAISNSAAITWYTKAIVKVELLLVAGYSREIQRIEAIILGSGFIPPSQQFISLPFRSEIYSWLQCKCTIQVKLFHTLYFFHKLALKSGSYSLH